MAIEFKKTLFTAGPWSPPREYAEVTGVIALVTVFGLFVPLSYWALGQVYLLVMVMLSLRVGQGPMLAAALLSGASWLYFSIPPPLSFEILNVDDGVITGTYLVVALVSGQLVARFRAATVRERRLAESDVLHRALFDSVSHELKTPLAVVRAAADALVGEVEGRPAQMVGEIREATDRLDRLVANLLNQTRLESEVLQPQMDWCDARDLIQAARRGVGNALAGHSVRVEIAEDLPLLRVDAALMEQALANLLVNAALHTPPGSPILIRAGIGPGRTFIAVADQGPGIPPEVRKHLFQKFTRGATARPGGLGLGLAIVHGFVTAQGGTVEAAKEPSGGEVVTIFLPLAAREQVPND